MPPPRRTTTYTLYLLTDQGWCDNYAEHSPQYPTIAAANTAALTLNSAATWLISAKRPPKALRCSC